MIMVGIKFVMVHLVCDEIIDHCRTSIFWSGQVIFFSLLVPGQMDLCDISTDLDSILTFNVADLSLNYQIFH